MNYINEKLLTLVETPSDINEHLYTLRAYATGCEHITEMGVRAVVSSWAFLAASPKKLVCIDINQCPIHEISNAAKNASIEFQFIKDSTVRDGFDIEPTDFLFIDTLHIYQQLKTELAKHANNVRKYIAFHDTFTFGFVNEGGRMSKPAGLRAAIVEFLTDNTEWTMASSYDHNNGVTILRRIVDKQK
jgi:hypothetical protein